MTIRRLIYTTFVATACLASLTSCYNYDEEEVNEVNVSNSYINLAIAVSGGTAHTRAGETPACGEDGNGREAGFERENTVSGITLILYKDANGINTAEDPTLDLVRYYSVTRTTGSTQGNSDQVEAVYTTGPQLIGKPGNTVLDITATYHAIVVANHNLTASLTEGSSKLSNVKDVALSNIYFGDNTKPASAISSFVMSSEADNTLNFTTATKTSDETGDITYDFSSQALVIERMAARIDFWAKGAAYQTKNGDGAGSGTYETPGYVYRPWKSSDTTEPTSADRFVITRITPFNLNDGTSYLLKQTNDTKKYLAVESGTNYVIDPATSTKTGSATPGTYNNALSGIASLTDLSGNAYCRTVVDMHAQVGTGLTGGFNYTESAITAEDVIICYPKENTLPDNSPLYYYATGIVIEGDYYVGDNTSDATKREHRVYFGYIRHQGESATAYDALLPTELDASVLTSSTRPMNFGVVRNNIYRISIDKVMEKTTEAPPKLKLLIKVKKWDKFVHAPIYI